MRLLRGHQNEFAGLQPVGLARDGDFGLTLDHLDEGIEGGGMFAQALPGVEGEDRDGAGRRRTTSRLTTAPS